MNNTNTMRYFKVRVLRGHLGCGKNHEITFFVEARDIIKAVTIALKMPGVKHNCYSPFAEEVTEEEYEKARKTSAYANFDGYEQIARSVI